MIEHSACSANLMSEYYIKDQQINMKISVCDSVFVMGVGIKEH